VASIDCVNDNMAIKGCQPPLGTPKLAATRSEPEAGEVLARRHRLNQSVAAPEVLPKVGSVRA
jgi:hypothetical protein